MIEALSALRDDWRNHGPLEDIVLYIERLEKRVEDVPSDRNEPEAGEEVG